MAGRRSAWIVVATALAVVISGCIDLDGGDDEGVIEDPAERTEHAMRTFGSALSGEGDADVKRLTGSFEGSFDDEEEGFSMSDSMEFDIDVIWGTGGVVQAVIGLKMGGMTLEISSWCSDSKVVVQWGSDVYESRPIVDGGEDEALCEGWDSMGSEADDGLDIFDEEGMEDLPEPVITENADGSLTAVFHEVEEGTTATVTVDNKGRVSRVAIEGDGVSGFFDVLYGARETLTVPEATSRMPASVDTETEWNPDSTVYRVTAAPEAPRLSEFEARWVETDWEAGTDTTLTEFSLTGGKQTALGISFEYRDLDGDGKISPGDEYEVWESGQQDFDRYREIQLYDLWAGAAVNTSPLPAPGFVPLLVLAALALAFVALRRRA